ncbi:PUA-like domain-containing protein [Hypomontagnella monticulosa]|nr:PUA-like domain-containing protein [Hypomontagnella monticulosa]
MAPLENSKKDYEDMLKLRRSLIALGTKSRHMGRPVNSADGQVFQDLLLDSKQYLRWLATIEMTPQFKAQSEMEDILQYLIDDPTMYYPDDLKKSALLLCEKWEFEGWGTNYAAADDDDEESVISTPNLSPVPSPQSPPRPILPPVAGIALPPQPPIPPVAGIGLSQSQILPPVAALGPTQQSPPRPIAGIGGPPPRDHPIYGVRGIMHGVVIGRNAVGGLTYRLNRDIPQRPSKVHGHNSLPVGIWFANQLVALHRGAHGSRMGGIAGTRDTGAYSIVVSSGYEGLDDDRGETLYYSGPNSHENADRQLPAKPTEGTKALRTSLRDGTVVRVLRSRGSKANQWLPSCGIRYDGLYRVVRVREPKNRKGGLYEQFELQREPGQPPLEGLCLNVPTQQQKLDHSRIKQGY